MRENTFIKLYRSMLSWEWYTDTNTKVLFLHLLLTVNHKDKPYYGKLIKRGQRVCSRASLADETGLSENEIRTAIKHLISTNEITSEKTRINRSNCTLLTVNKYDEYQSSDQSLTSESPVINQKQEIKKDKERKKVYIPPISPLNDLSETVQHVFRSFMEMRVKMKKPMTDEAVRLAVNKLKGMASEEATQIAIINQSIERCWQTFYPLKEETKKSPPDKFANLKRMYEEAVREEAMQNDQE